MHSPFLSVVNPFGSALGNVPRNLNNQTTRINGSIFYSLNSKDSISVVSDRNSFSSSPVGTFDISLSRHFQVFENLKVPTSGPCHASSSSPKELGMFFTLKNCPQQQEHHQ